MKHVFFSLLLLTFVSCKDGVIGNHTETKEIRTPGVCPEPPYSNPPDVDFAGIERIDSIEQSRMKIHWTPVEEARAYLVYLKKPGEKMRLHQSFNHPKDNAWIYGLSPDTEYQVSVKMLDERGLFDLNENVLSAVTSSRPSYQNKKSLYFDGFASVSLKGADVILPRNRFTISLWFKTSYRQSLLDARLITLHRGFSAGSGLTVGVRKDQMFLGYKDGNNSSQEIVHNLPYHDNLWHHVAVTYNGTYLVLYIDGKRIKLLKESLAGFGSHPIHIGAYTGNKKGFTGLIDEVSLWTTAMSSQSVLQVYNQGSAADLHEHPRSNSLKAWHRLGDDPRDGSSHLYDQMEEAHGSPLNIEPEDFTLESP